MEVLRGGGQRVSLSLLIIINLNEGRNVVNVCFIKYLGKLVYQGSNIKKKKDIVNDIFIPLVK